MHELSVTENLLRLTLRYAENADATKVTKLHLVIGKLSSIVDDSVQFYWQEVARGTIAEGAELCFTRVPATLHCDGCGADFLLSDQVDYLCPQCRGGHVRITSGDEFRLESIEVS